MNGPLRASAQPWNIKRSLECGSKALKEGHVDVRKLDDGSVTCDIC